MISLKQISNGFAVTFHGTEFSVAEVRTFEMAKDLCRLRLEKCRKSEFAEEPLTIIKVPFRNMWLVW